MLTANLLLDILDSENVFTPKFKFADSLRFTKLSKLFERVHVSLSKIEVRIFFLSLTLCVCQTDVMFLVL